MERRLIPHLGQIRLEKLTADDIGKMFEEVDRENAWILEARASDDPEVRKSVAGRRTCLISTKRRNPAVLRSALGETASSAPAWPRDLTVCGSEACPQMLRWATP